MRRRWLIDWHWWYQHRADGGESVAAVVALADSYLRDEIRMGWRPDLR